MKMKQSELLKQLTDQEVKKSLLLSQTFILLIAFGLSFILFQYFSDWLTLFYWDVNEIFIYGVIPGFIIVLVDIFLMLFLPKKWLDDGGINERIFKVLSLGEIFLYTWFIAIAEELLFRGVLQTVFGFFSASVIFILVHFRYLNKPVLLISVIVTSFLLGFLYEATGNLYTVIVTHFIVDFLLGMIIHFKR